MGNYDVVVVGGGPAGIAAAFSASKLGLKTAIIERHAMLGGNWTNGYVLSILGMYTYDGSEKIAGGIADEVVEWLKGYGGTKGKAGNFIPFRPDEMKIILGELAKKYDIDVYFNSLVSGAAFSGSAASEVKVTGKNGIFSISGKMFVDSSGDADLVYNAKLGFLEGKENEGWHQEATIPFRIGNINENDIIIFSQMHPDLVSVKVNENGRLERFRLMPNLIEKAKRTNELYLPNANAEFMFNTSREGEFVCNATHVKISNFTDGKEMAEVIEDARRQVASSLEFLKKEIHGFEESYLLDSAPSIGMRETRRAVGEYVLRKDDVLSNARFDDAIARCGHPIEIHDPEKGVVYIHLNGGDSSWYHIPYGAIVVKNVDNMFAIGRCLSAEFEAQASARVTGTAMAMGQAAATAAKLAIDAGIPARKVDTKKLQETLRQNGMII